MNHHLSLRPITDCDLPFLAGVYASTRTEEMALTGWSSEEINLFLQMQFELQHKHYQTNYAPADFSVIECDGQSVGRLYVQRTGIEIRIIDIALLSKWRRQGIGRELLNALIRESEEKQLFLSLHVEFNNPIRDFYNRLGFSEGELRGVYYYMERRPGMTAGLI